MRYAWFAALIVFALGVQALPQNKAAQAAASQQSAAGQKTGVRKIPCKIPENASMCYWTRGRLRFYSIGLPTYRMWKIGTNRVLGIYGGPSAYPPRDDDDPDIFPAKLDRVYELETERNTKLNIDTPWMIGDVFADFEVCPLEPGKPGNMQAACIESAKDIFAYFSKRGYK